MDTANLRPSFVPETLARSLPTMKLQNLEDLLLHELRDLHSAECQLIQLLPKVASVASNAQLKEDVELHFEQTEVHRQRLDKIFELLGKSPEGDTGHAMTILIEECLELLDEETEECVRDAGIISATQRIEHYEIAGYGTARTFAEALGHDAIAQLLAETLVEEKAADETLSSLAEWSVNIDAAKSPISS